MRPHRQIKHVFDRYFPQLSPSFPDFLQNSQSFPDFLQNSQSFPTFPQNSPSFPTFPQNSPAASYPTHCICSITPPDQDAMKNIANITLLPVDCGLSASDFRTRQVGIEKPLLVSPQCIKKGKVQGVQENEKHHWYRAGARSEIAIFWPHCTPLMK